MNVFGWCTRAEIIEVRVINRPKLEHTIFAKYGTRRSYSRPELKEMTKDECICNWLVLNPRGAK